MPQKPPPPPRDEAGERVSFCELLDAQLRVEQSVPAPMPPQQPPWARNLEAQLFNLQGQISALTAMKSPGSPPSDLPPELLGKSLERLRTPDERSLSIRTADFPDGTN